MPLGGTQAGAAGVGEGRNAVEFLWQVFTECGRKAAGVASGAEEEEGAEVTVEDLSREEGSGELAVLESYRRAGVPWCKGDVLLAWARRGPVASWALACPGRCRTGAFANPEYLSHLFVPAVPCWWGWSWTQRRWPWSS